MKCLSRTKKTKKRFRSVKLRKAGVNQTPKGTVNKKCVQQKKIFQDVATNPTNYLPTILYETDNFPFEKQVLIRFELRIIAVAGVFVTSRTSGPRKNLI